MECREAFAHLRIGVPMALQFSVTAVGIMILQAYLNEYGALVVAGYTAAGKVENLVTQPFNALAMAMEVYCGQNMGAGKRERIRCGIRQCIALGTVCVILSSTVNVCLGRPFIGLFMETCDPKIAGVRICVSGHHCSLFLAIVYHADHEESSFRESGKQQFQWREEFWNYFRDGQAVLLFRGYQNTQGYISQHLSPGGWRFFF
ncbi:MAG: MATE family efflux transporter [Pilosibacter sp.]